MHFALCIVQRNANFTQFISLTFSHFRLRTAQYLQILHTLTQINRINYLNK